MLHTFNGSDGAEPQSVLVRDSSGNLYGTTEYGGTAGAGVVFRLAGTSEASIYNFQDVPDGARPFAALINGGYGTTYTGGTTCAAPYSCGTAFKLDRSGSETVLYRFQGAPDGANPYSALMREASGDLYGTTITGGDTNCNFPFGCGVVFKLGPSGNETILHTFTGPPDGDSPYGTLISDSAGNLYGTTAYGGQVNSSCPIGCGVIFELVLSSNGWKEKILHSFTGANDGSNPYAGLIRDVAGNFYGTTAAGGTNGRGTVFKLNSSFQLSLLHSFAGGSDGSEPFDSLVRDSKGNLYGTTVFGGTTTTNCFQGCGTVFRVTPNGAETVLHRFVDAEGTNPFSALLLDEAHGLVYGTASLGGNLKCDSGSGDGIGCGTAFKISH